MARDAERERWLDDVVTMTEGAALRKVSVDTLRKEGKKGRIHIIKLSERRRGITDALLFRFRFRRLHGLDAAAF